MNKQREALELARAATPHDQLITELLDSRTPKTEREHAAAREIKRLIKALTDPEQEPVAHHSEDALDMVINAEPEPVAEVKTKTTGGNVGIATVIHEIYSPNREPLKPGDNLYTAPPARKPLTDREITSLMINHDFDSAYRDRIHSLIRAVELVHGIGGEG